MKLIIIIILSNIILAQDCDDGYTYIPASEISFSTVSIPYENGQPYTCFSNGDIEFLNELNQDNNLGYNSPISIGNQTWNFGKLKIFVGTYTPTGSGINTTQLQTLPESISNLNELTTLYLEWHHITELPNSFTELTSLKNLYINNNRLESINSNFGDLSQLEILDLGYNYISYIPDSITQLENLEYLWIFNNDISYLPQDICNLNIQWDEMDLGFYPYFAIGGNELCFEDEVPECILNSEHFNQSLDQFYYSFMYIIEQDCADINEDGSVNILDVVMMANNILQNNLPESDTELYNYMDVNDDGAIDILDLVQLVNAILGIS